MNAISVLINSYNYGRFVAEAVESVLRQSHAPAEIIVVDDGSTDDTLAVLAAKFGDNPMVKVIHQRNAGQLAAFVTGFEQATGDLLAMLDADDTFTADHLHNLARAFSGHPDVDFAFTAHRQFGEANAVMQRAPRDQKLGFSVIGTYARDLWVGSVTSTLALRRSLVLTLLPGLRTLIPRWKVRADDCLVLGASLAGSQKFYLAEPTVNYRVHPGNFFYRREAWPADRYAHWLRRESLKSLFSAQLGIPVNIVNRVEVEFATQLHPSRPEYNDYVSIVWSLRLSLWSRLRKRIKLYAHFRRTRRTKARPLLSST